MLYPGSPAIGQLALVIPLKFNLISITYFRHCLDDNLMTALHYACHYAKPGKPEIAEFLIEEDKKIQEQEGGQEGKIQLYNQRRASEASEPLV